MPTRAYSDLIALNVALGISVEVLTARALPVYPEAYSLEVAETAADGREHLLHPAAASAWRKLKAAAFDDGIVLCIVSAFRSIERQTEIVRRKLDAGVGVDEVLSLCAPPGFSEHHTGYALDLTTPGGPALQTEFELTPAFAWLAAHASEFGFHLSYPPGNRCGYCYEPWHWRFEDTGADA